MASVNLSPLFNGQTVFGTTGNILAGGQIFTYQAGSSTPLATYTTYNGNIANQNPIVLGADGKLPNELWLQAGYSYKFVVEDANSVLVNTYDNIAGILTTIPSSSPSLPSGCILIWSGTVGSIPSGFVICDGSNGTPDLRNSFVIGAGNSYTVGQTGGSADSALPAHTHNGTTNGTSNGHTHGITDNGHQHSYRLDNNGANIGIVGNQGNIGGVTLPTGTGTQASISTATQSSTTGITGTNGQSADHTHTFTTNSTGITPTGTNLPPYYALAFIMKS